MLLEETWDATSSPGPQYSPKAPVTPPPLGDGGPTGDIPHLGVTRTGPSQPNTVYMEIFARVWPSAGAD